MAEKMVLILHIYFNKIWVALWCSGQGFACKARWTEFYSRRRWFLLLCAVLFFFLFSFFFNTQSFSLVFLYSYCPPCWSRTFINIYFKLKLGEFYFKSSWSAYWPSLRPEKKHKLSRHVPPLKQLYFSLDVSWHPWQTTHSTDTTNCTNLH